MHSKIKAETTAKTAVTYWKAGNISDSEVPLLAAWLWGRPGQGREARTRLWDEYSSGKRLHFVLSDPG